MYVLSVATCAQRALALIARSWSHRALALNMSEAWSHLGIVARLLAFADSLGSGQPQQLVLPPPRAPTSRSPDDEPTSRSPDDEPSPDDDEEVQMGESEVADAESDPEQPPQSEDVIRGVVFHRLPNECDEDWIERGCPVFAFVHVRTAEEEEAKGKGKGKGELGQASESGKGKGGGPYGVA